MKKIIIPTDIKKDLIEKVTIDPDVVVGTSVGLVKDTNEDRLGCIFKKNCLRICIADGHWGEAAAKVIVKHWMEKGIKFPENKKEVFWEVTKIEQQLFKLFGKTNMDPDSDFTPEASFIVVQIVEKILSVVSFGDCRLLIANEGKVKIKLTTNETWLGAFSQLGLRNRISLHDGLVFEKITLQENDGVLIFTDGIDQCVYEKDTLSDEFLANLTNKKTAENTFISIFKAVFTAGAEDNATLAVLKIRQQV